MSTTRKIGIGLNAVMDDVQKLEARACAAECEVVRLLNEKMRMQDAMARPFAEIWSVRNDYRSWGSAQQVILRIEPKMHSVAITAEALLDARRPYGDVVRHIDGILEGHTRALRTDLEKAVMEAARNCNNDPRAYAYR